MRGEALIWMCKHCRWITVSDQTPHRMDTCKCEKTHVDFEVDYCRILGDGYTPIAVVNLDTGEVTHENNTRNTKKQKV